jgi:hypothetical protein
MFHFLMIERSKKGMNGCADRQDIMIFVQLRPLFVYTSTISCLTGGTQHVAHQQTTTCFKIDFFQIFFEFLFTEFQNEGGRNPRRPRRRMPRRPPRRRTGLILSDASSLFLASRLGRFRRKAQTFAKVQGAICCRATVQFLR